MGWSNLPVAPGAEVTAAQANEIRAAIIERRRAVGLSSTGGLGDPPLVSAGAACDTATVNADRERLEGLFASFINTNGTGQPWTKAAILEAALGAGQTEWTSVPARAGAAQYAAALPAGTVMYAEHLNEMKEVIDKLYLVSVDEKAGRQYAYNYGSGWTWSQDDDDPTSVASAVGNYGTSQVSEKAQSAPFGFARSPLGNVTVVAVRAKGVLGGTGGDLTAKSVNFIHGDEEDPQPSDRDWKATLRSSPARPLGDPRAGTTVVFEDNLADDGSHSSDGKNTDHALLEVYIYDTWGPEEVTGLPAPEAWPFWLTFVLEDYAGVVAAYAAEAAETGRDLQIYYANVFFDVRHVWAELDFEYLDK